MTELSLVALGVFLNFLVEKPELRNYIKIKLKKLFSFGPLRSNKPDNSNTIIVD